MDTECLICLYDLTRQSKIDSIESLNLSQLSERDEAFWCHFDRSAPGLERILADKLGLAPLVIESLTAEETRPRYSELADGHLLILRGINFNPKSEPEDMISIRLYITHNQIISVRLRPLMAVHDIREALDKQVGPANIGHFVVMLIEKLVDRMEGVINEVEESMDEVEEQLMENNETLVREQLTQLRRRSIVLRRHMVPQREVLANLVKDAPSWLAGPHVEKIQACWDRLTRYVENLDMNKERAVILQDEIKNQLSEALNKHMYILTLVAGIFLPLGLLTGLFGINIGGMPGVEHPTAFTLFTVVLLILAALELWYLKYKKWF